jgi:hypothetical protein
VSVLGCTALHYSERGAGAGEDGLWRRDRDSNLPGKIFNRIIWSGWDGTMILDDGLRLPVALVKTVSSDT